MAAVSKFQMSPAFANFMTRSYSQFRAVFESEGLFEPEGTSSCKCLVPKVVDETSSWKRVNEGPARVGFLEPALATTPILVGVCFEKSHQGPNYGSQIILAESAGSRQLCR